MKANGVLSGSGTLAYGQPHNPCMKLTCVKSVLEAVAKLFKDIDDDNSIKNYVEGLDGGDELVPQTFGLNEDEFSETDSGKEILDGFFETVNGVLNSQTP